LRLKTWEKVNPKRVEAKRLLIPLYLTNKEIQNATKEAECLVENSKEPIDLDMAAKPFLFAGNFKRALELLTQLYEAVPNEEVLFKIVQIMDEFTGERKKAIQLLETYRRMNHASTELHTMLLVLYQKERNVDGILQTYKALYKENKDEAYLSKIIDAYMFKRDLEGAIDFLEQDQTREDFLYELYKAKKDFDKALLLVDKLYAADQNAKWLAEKAVLIFEKAQDKNDKKMIQDVLDYFEKAIALGNDDSIYLNYYGYTLIDKEVDIKKGMNVIQNALVQQPENIYYLDSLAWGYYKQHQCDEAYKLMKKIVDEDGLNEKEIVDHWDAIRQCK
jgi:tetratricopeptide (TPR) repeat protein